MLHRGVSVLIVISATLVTLGCDPKIDGSSDEAFARSMNKVRGSLSSPEARLVFDEGVTLASRNPADLEAQFPETFPARTPVQIRDLLGGRTATEILALYDSLSLRRDSMALRMLRFQKARSDSARSVISSVLISDPQFRVVRYNDRFAKIDATFTNRTAFAISSADAHVVLRSPGRSVPWAEDNFTFFFDGGLEPGESRRETVYGDAIWRMTEAPPTAQLLIELRTLSTAEEPAQFTLLIGFEKADSLRLAALETKLATAKAR